MHWPCKNSPAVAAIHIYPNPNQGQFTIALTKEAHITLTTITGAVLLHETKPEGKHVIDLQEQAKGIYFINIIQGSNIQSFKVIKD